MSDLLPSVQDAVEAVIFGNGWLALAGLALVAGATAVVRLSGGIRV